jgi:hypothetical protein
LAAAATSVLLLAGFAWAARPAHERAAAESTLNSVIAVPNHRKLAAEPVRLAQAALKRSQDARAAGDTEHAAMLDALALEWASMAEALVRAVSLERKSAQVQRKAADVETRSIRAKALLEETLARRGRARRKLEQLQQPAGGAGADAEPQGKP